MSAHPFLSHKREDAAKLEVLRAELAQRGAAGWQDVRELRLGERWLAAFRRAIGRDTNGFIWWGTKLSLSSETICKVELPRALRRARRRWYRRRYPVVPLFVDLTPGTDRHLVEEALGKKKTDQLFGLQGVVKRKREPIAAFARRSARRYIKDVVRNREGKALRVEITGGRQPTRKNDLVLDWRALLDERGDPLSPEAVAIATETLADIREAAQESAQHPHIIVEPHLRLPLAALVGWEWNKMRPINLDVVQVSNGDSFVVDDERRRDVHLPDPVIFGGIAGNGPAVIAVSVGKSLTHTLARYVEEVNARGGVHLHLPLAGDDLLGGPQIAATAAWVVEKLARTNDLGHEKHLILLGPISLAVRIGATAHGTGKTWIPFWNGESGYQGGITIGGSSLGGPNRQIKITEDTSP